MFEANPRQSSSRGCSSKIQPQIALTVGRLLLMDLNAEEKITGIEFVGAKQFGVSISQNLFVECTIASSRIRKSRCSGSGR
jgi:hypothetical protein